MYAFVYGIPIAGEPVVCILDGIPIAGDPSVCIFYGIRMPEVDHLFP